MQVLLPWVFVPFITDVKGQVIHMFVYDVSYKNYKNVTYYYM